MSERLACTAAPAAPSVAEPSLIDVRLRGGRVARIHVADAERLVQGCWAIWSGEGRRRHVALTAAGAAKFEGFGLRKSWSLHGDNAARVARGDNSTRLYGKGQKIGNTVEFSK